LIFLNPFAKTNSNFRDADRSEIVSGWSDLTFWIKSAGNETVILSLLGIVRNVPDFS